MSTITLMASALNDELRDRGIFQLDQASCETIIRAVLQRTAEVGRAVEAKLQAEALAALTPADGEKR